MFRQSIDAQASRIQIKLRDINQLFNTMDPSPFHEKDLDVDAEEFIVSWAREFPLHQPLILTIHLSEMVANPQPDSAIEEAVHHYFSYRADMIRLEFRRLMRDGRLSLLIGLVFLSACLVVGHLITRQASWQMTLVIQEGLTIAGWVAMWRPLQIYLYEWWPLRRRWKIFEKLGEMKIEIVRPGPGTSGTR
jgi:hypothetical protein